MSDHEMSQLSQLLEEVQAIRQELGELRGSILGKLGGTPGLETRVSTLECTLAGRKWLEKTIATYAIAIIVGLAFTAVGYLVVQIRPQQTGGTVNVNTSQRSP